MEILEVPDFVVAYDREDHVELQLAPQYAAVIEAARVLAAKNLDNITRSTLHQAIHDGETVRALHRLVFAVKDLEEVEDD